MNLLGESAQLFLLELEFRRHPLAKGVRQGFEVDGVPSHRPEVLATVFGLLFQNRPNDEGIPVLAGHVPGAGTKAPEPFEGESVHDVVAVLGPYQPFRVVLCQRIDPEEKVVLLGLGQLGGFWHECTLVGGMLRLSRAFLLPYGR